MLMTDEEELEQEREMLRKLPKLRSRINRDANGNIQSISTYETDEPLWTEEQIQQIVIPKWLRHRFNERNFASILDNPIQGEFDPNDPVLLELPEFMRRKK